MQKQYDAVVAQNKSLQSELRLANKMIEFLTKAFLLKYSIVDLPFIGFNTYNKEVEIDIKNTINFVRDLTIKELGE